MGVGAEAFTAESLVDDHPEKALALDELPSLGRQILPARGGFPIVGEIGQRCAVVVEECALLVRQRGRAVREERVPIGAAGPASCIALGIVFVIPAVVLTIRPLRRAHIERSNEMAASGLTASAPLSVQNANA